MMILHLASKCNTGNRTSSQFNYTIIFQCNIDVPVQYENFENIAFLDCCCKNYTCNDTVRNILTRIIQMICNLFMELDVVILKVNHLLCWSWFLISAFLLKKKKRKKDNFRQQTLSFSLFTITIDMKLITCVGLTISGNYVPQTKFGNILFLLCFLLRSSVFNGRPYCYS